MHDVIENDANNSVAVEAAVSTLREASVEASTPTELNATTGTLNHLARARAGIKNAVVTHGEILVSVLEQCEF